MNGQTEDQESNPEAGGAMSEQKIMSPEDQARWDELQQELFAVRAQIDEIKTRYDNKEAESFVGRFFKYRNCYSCPENESDYWWMYTSVIANEDGALQTFEFQKDRDGRITFESRSVHSSRLFQGHVEIEQAEFDKALAATAKAVRLMEKYA